MSSLNIETKTIHSVDYQDFSDFVAEVYGQPFDFVADQECSNDSAQTFSVTKEQDDFEKTQVQEYVKTGNHFFLSRFLLKDLAMRDLIPEGDYVINVYW